jgi:hypothetical protein
MTTVPSQPVKIFVARLIIDGAHYAMDVIEHEGSFWLVPEWIDDTAAGVSMPRRIVSLATIPHEVMRADNPKIVVNYPVPKSVFDGAPPSEIAGKYVVIELPEIRIPITRKLH